MWYRDGDHGSGRLSGFGVVIRVKTEDQAKKLARKIVDSMDDPRPVDIYKFEIDPIPGITCKRGHYYLVG